MSRMNFKFKINVEGIAEEFEKYLENISSTGRAERCEYNIVFTNFKCYIVRLYGIAESVYTEIMKSFGMRIFDMHDCSAVVEGYIPPRITNISNTPDKTAIGNLATNIDASVIVGQGLSLEPAPTFTLEKTKMRIFVTAPYSNGILLPYSADMLVTLTTRGRVGKAKFGPYGDIHAVELQGEQAPAAIVLSDELIVKPSETKEAKISAIQQQIQKLQEECDAIEKGK